jgi:LCP family protein required for cell wall assembly
VSNPKVKVYVSSETSKRPRNYRWLWRTLGLSAVAVVSAGAGALLAVAIASTPLLQSNLSPEEAEVFEQEESISTNMTFRMPELTRPVNILVLGVKVLVSDLADPPPELADLHYDALVNSFDGLSDTMLLLRFDPDTGKLIVLSIPRDTRTWVEDVGLTKLNEANAYGGPALAATAISELLGDVPIDRYVRINVQGVEKLIDALGGVSVYVPQDMRYQDDSQHLYINLQEGEQHLDGSQALQFLRFRYDENGDIGRVQRQQMFLRSLLEQALNPRTITRIPQILSVIQDNVDTNLSVEELVALAGFATQTDRSQVQMLMLPGEFSAPGDYELSYWLPYERSIDQMVSQYFNSGSHTIEASTPDYLNIAIQDSTGESVATDELLNRLYDSGYTGVYFSEQPWEQSLDVTQIIAQRGDRASAEAIQQALGIGEVLVDSTGDLRSDVTIQLGQDWLQYLETQPSPPQPSETEEF